MTTCSLTLSPAGRQPFSVVLAENDGRRGNREQIGLKTADVCIFSDLSYEFALACDEPSAIQKVDVYINDVLEPSVYDNGKILFTDGGKSDRRIFMDCYGFVEISLVLVDTEGTEHSYSTDYLPVLVRRGELNEAVKAMVQYVYAHQERLLLHGEPKARNPASLKENGYKNLSAQIILAEEIAALYESSYGYFKANSRFKLEKVARIDRLERLQYVTPATVRFTATHPEELRQINSNAGIRIGNVTYQPQKTLSLQNERSYDTYENRVILGFIREMINSVNELYDRGSSLLGQIPSDEEYSSEYIYSSFFMFLETRRMLENDLARLTRLHTKFAQLWAMYSSALNIQPDAMLSEPHPSPIFMAVPQYNRIFVQIHRWFRFGIYDFTQENFMLSFIKISSLYEVYLLTKLVAYFQSRGYTLEEEKRYSYPVKRDWKYKNTNCRNTFVFTDERRKLTLYYQPVIFDTDESAVNGIGLSRNNSIPVSTGNDDDDRSGGRYYSPDYLIKVEEGSSARYLILDAKFSDLRSVRRYHVKELAFKYLFSVSTIQPTDTVVGLCALYGKCDASERIQTAYDKQLPDQKIRPVTELLPLMESVANEEHSNGLDMLMKRAFAS